MKEVLEKMIAQLSDEDKVLFSQLAEKIDQLGGDISKLSKQELDLIAKMETKYAEKLSQFKPEVTENKPAKDLLDTGFASFARQVMAKDLKDSFPNEEDAIQFAFNNKWIPESFKDVNTAEKIYSDYEHDICEANNWRKEVVGVESDKVMAVGMTWFMVVFQLNQK
jgi:hypothetical protein